MERGVCPCDCRRQKILRVRLQDIPERFRDVTFQGFIPRSVPQQEIRDRIWNDFTGSYFICGDYGCGKTHLATAQYIRLLQIERSAMFFTMAELLGELHRSALDSDYFCTVRHRARSAEKFHLFIDDIDKFKVTDFKHEVLFDLMDTIYKRKLGLTITSNYTLSELATAGSVHPSIVRRIDDICAVVQL